MTVVLRPHGILSKDRKKVLKAFFLLPLFRRLVQKIHGSLESPCVHRKVDLFVQRLAPYDVDAKVLRDLFEAVCITQQKVCGLPQKMVCDLLGRGLCLRNGRTGS